MEPRIFRRVRFIAAVTFLAVSLPVLAQELPPPPLPPPPPEGVSIMGPRMFFFSNGMNHHQVVTGKPYSATETTVTTQVMADGNRIVNTETAELSRDSQGRTRQDRVLSSVGPWPVQGKPPEIVDINDPVAGARYMLNVENKTATKWNPPAPPSGAAAGAINPAKNYFFTATTNGESSGAIVYKRQEGPGMNFQKSTEPLGNRIIEGVLAQGTRTTMTIPAGAIGNEKPIIVTDERWYAPAIQADVLTKHTDPRFGETDHQLTNLSLKEPDPSLFQVPPDYAVTEGKGNFTMRLGPRP